MYPQLAEFDLATPLHVSFYKLCTQNPLPFIPGAQGALAQAHTYHKTAIVTSSQRPSLEHLLHALPDPHTIDVTLCGDDCLRSKPDPEGYLKAAKKLEVDPKHCLVFEDSLAGLTAAKTAGMMRIAITHRPFHVDQARALSHFSIANYTELPALFFKTIGLDNRSSSDSNR